jgi:head-tail adaptor
MKAGNFNTPATHLRPVATMTNGSHETTPTTLGRAWVRITNKRTTESGAADQQINTAFVVLQVRGEREYRPEDLMILPAVRLMPQRTLRITGVKPMMANGAGLELDCVEVLA